MRRPISSRRRSRINKKIIKKKLNKIKYCHSFRTDAPDRYPLWIKFATKKMNSNGSVKNHIAEKVAFFIDPTVKERLTDLPFLMATIVNTLPDTWPKKFIYEKLSSIKSIIELRNFLEDVELDVIAVAAFDAYERATTIESAMSTLSM